MRARILGRLTLSVVEVSRNGNHRLVDLLPEIIFGRLLHLLQDHRRNLRRAVILAARLDADVAVAGGLHFVRDLFDSLRSLRCSDGP